MANSGFGMVPLPEREDDRVPGTPSALERREAFERRHPEVTIRAERENGQLRFHVREPGRGKPAVWTDANKMMDDLEKRYPS